MAKNIYRGNFGNCEYVQVINVIDIQLKGKCTPIIPIYFFISMSRWGQLLLAQFLGALFDVAC